jgi:hypothetical protein
MPPIPVSVLSKAVTGGFECGWGQSRLSILFLDGFAKFEKRLLASCRLVRPSLRPSACPHGATQFPLDGF